MKLFTSLTISMIPVASAFVPMLSTPARIPVQLHMGTRRDVLCEIGSLATAIVVAQPGIATAEVVVAPASTIPADNEIVKEQRTVVDKLDVNNSAVADYMKFPGMYPTIGGKIANNGPYASVKDVYKSGKLSEAEIKVIKKYESKLTATPATGLDTLRGRDPYRRAFNQ